VIEEWALESALGVMKTVKANVNIARKRAEERDDALSTQWLNVEFAVNKWLELYDPTKEPRH
jgi:hypothetical protein